MVIKQRKKRASSLEKPWNERSEDTDEAAVLIVGFATVLLSPVVRQTSGKRAWW